MAAVRGVSRSSHLHGAEPGLVQHDGKECVEASERACESVAWAPQQRTEKGVGGPRQQFLTADGEKWRKGRLDAPAMKK